MANQAVKGKQRLGTALASIGQTRLFFAFCAFTQALCLLFWFYLLYLMLRFNPARGDECQVFIEAWHVSFVQLFLNIRHGIDNSILHPLLVWFCFKIFGHTLLVQRLLSLAFFTAGIVFLLSSFRKLFRSPLLVSILGLSVVLSNIGLFLASDGRFYAVLFFLSVLFITYNLHSLKNRTRPSILILLVISLAGWLTSPLFVLIVLLYLSSLGLSLLWRGERFLRQHFYSVLSVTLTSAIIYYLFFRIPFFTEVQRLAFFSHHSMPFLEVVQFYLTTFFRWTAIPFPSPGSMWSGVFTLCILLIPLALARRRLAFKNLPEASLVALFNGLLSLILLLLLVGFQTALPMNFILEFRYFTPVFFCFSFLLGYLLNSCTLSARKWLVAIISAGYMLGLWGWMNRYDIMLRNRSDHIDRVAKLLDSQNTVVFEHTQSGPFTLFSALYCRYPHLRDKLILKSLSTDSKRLQHFGMLAREYPEFHFSVDKHWPETRMIHLALQELTEADEPVPANKRAVDIDFPGMKLVLPVDSLNSSQ